MAASRSPIRRAGSSSGSGITKVRAVGAVDDASAASDARARTRIQSAFRPKGHPANITTLPAAPRDERLIARGFEQALFGNEETTGRRAYRIAKRLLDIVVSLLALTLLSPALLIVALIIRIDSPGPALFIQRRVGQHGRVFGMWKFRTMAAGEPDRFDEPLHKLTNDPRLTRVGRFLRRSSIDEIPQLINVLRGDMSLVGPRPEIVEIAQKHYEPWQYRRLLVPQGMTGWWQVTGRGTKLLRENTEDDLYYIEQASFWFDLKILAVTVRSVLRREGAF